MDRPALYLDHSWQLESRATVRKTGVPRLLGQTGLWPVEQPRRLFALTAEDGCLPINSLQRLRYYGDTLAPAKQQRAGVDYRWPLERRGVNAFLKT